MKKIIAAILLLVCASQVEAQTEVKTTRETKFLDCQGIEFAHFQVIPAGEQIQLTDYYDGYFTATYKAKIGYIYYPYLAEVAGLDDIKKKGNEKNAGKKVESCLLTQFKKKYGEKEGVLAYQGKPWIGMSSGVAVEMFGQPKTVNTTKTEGNKGDQWVYDNLSMYLYFDNGKLTAIQSSSTIQK